MNLPKALRKKASNDNAECQKRRSNSRRERQTSTQRKQAKQNKTSSNLSYNGDSGPACKVKKR